MTGTVVVVNDPYHASLRFDFVCTHRRTQMHSTYLCAAGWFTSWLFSVWINGRRIETLQRPGRLASMEAAPPCNLMISHGVSRPAKEWDDSDCEDPFCCAAILTRNSSSSRRAYKSILPSYRENSTMAPSNLCTAELSF